MEYIAFGFIVDDIVFADGKTNMGMVGGGGPQAAFGMKLWSKSVGLVAGIGKDLPASTWDWLNNSCLDLNGLQINDYPTPRAWQVLEDDGRRTQVWRVPGEVIGIQLGRSINKIPKSYQNAKGYHYGIHPESPDINFIKDLSRLGGIISLETFKPADSTPDAALLKELFRYTDIFSPNLIEAISLVGQGDFEDLALNFSYLGAKLIALRMGETGAYIYNAEANQSVSIPPVPVNFVDPVGAGNAFCGGFLVGWSETRDIVTAGLYGSVAASFLVEQTGVPIVTPEVKKLAQERFETARKSVKFKG